ncbi:MAG TPA: hypothetical protein VF177_03150 [Anaerolineae bacterium]
MLRMGAETSRSPQDVVQAAAQFFGPDGTGLTLVQRSDDAVRFEGGGGYVSVQARPKDGGAELDIETREWEYQVRQFLTQI